MDLFAKRLFPLAVLLCSVLQKEGTAVAAGAAPTPAVAPTTVAKPGRAELSALLKQGRPKQAFHISLVLEALGDGRFPVLLSQVYHCDKEDHLCEESASPRLAMVRRSAGGTLELGELLAIPTQDSAEEEFTWGQTTVKDWDGDGRPELLVIYRYRSPIKPGVEEPSYFRELAVLNLDPKLSVALHVELPENAKFRFAPRSAGAPDFVLNTLTDNDSTAGPTKKRKKSVTEAKIFHYDPVQDRWIDPAAAKAPAPTNLSR